MKKIQNLRKTLKNKKIIPEKDYHLNNPEGQVGQQEEENSKKTEEINSSNSMEGLQVDKFLAEISEKGLSAFSPELNFIEDEDGDYVLSQLQIEILQRISLIQDYIETEEYIDKVDRRILEFDILIQKNKFENQINVNREDNLCRYWDDCVLFERNWKDPLNTKTTSDYYMNFEVKRASDDFEAYIPGFMLIGFDVDDDFVPNLTIDINKELFDKVYSFSKYYQRDVVFFVSSKKIYVLRYGSWSELPIIDKEDIFDDFMDFLNFSVTHVEDAYSDGSEELLKFYVEMKTQFEKKN